MRLPPSSAECTRRQQLHAALACAACWAQPRWIEPAHAEVAAPPRVTDRVFLDIRIIQQYDVEVLEDASIRGRLTFDLYGDVAPLGVKKFLGDMSYAVKIQEDADAAAGDDDGQKERDARAAADGGHDYQQIADLRRLAYIAPMPRHGAPAQSFSEADETAPLHPDR